MYMYGIIIMFRKIAKHLLIMSNSSGSVLGASMMVSGSIVLMVFKNYLTVFNATFIQNVMRSMMTMGGLILGITLLGSLGAIFEGKFGQVTLSMYALLVLFTIAIHIYVTVVLYDYRESRKNKVYLKTDPLKNNETFKTNLTADSLKSLPFFPATVNVSDGLLFIESKRRLRTSKRRRINIFDTTQRKAGFDYIKTYRAFTEPILYGVDERKQTSDSNDNRDDSSQRIKIRTDTNGSTASASERGDTGTLYNAWLSSVLGLLLPKKLEPDDNKHVQKLQPILGALSKPLLFMSLNTDSMIVAILTAVLEGYSLVIAIYLAMTKEDIED